MESAAYLQGRIDAAVAYLEKAAYIERDLLIMILGGVPEEELKQDGLQEEAQA